jgi:glutamate formiminotransferase / formiminotetrahydrofolate cyclodeaminase
VSDVELKNIDPGYATNRTVVTFVGSPEAAVEAAYRAIAKAAELIDMSKHRGEHPRFGATDVCPFVPVEGVTMEDCAELARILGKRVGERLGIPVFLYERAAATAERCNLANVRRGEYEALPERLCDPHWKPDFGPAEFNARTGAIAIGAREFLIAYNVTLNTDDKDIATDIAFELREKGRAVRTGNIEPFYNKGTLQKYETDKYRCGECDFTAQTIDALETHCKDAHDYSIMALLKANDIDPKNCAGKSVYKKGLYKNCKAIGWFVKEYGRAQISINLTDYNVTPPHIVLEKVRELAAKRGVVVTGSEIVGLVPYRAILNAGKYYLQKQQRPTGIPAQDIVKNAIYSMGLNDVSPFDPCERILGLPQTAKDALVALTAEGFADEVSRQTPAPGGGSVAALCGALGAALATMVANLSSAKSDSAAKSEPFNGLAEKGQAIKNELIFAVDADTQAFNDYLAAVRMPKKTDCEKTVRNEAIQAGLKSAVTVPLKTAELSFDALVLSSEIAHTGNPSSITDAGVGAQCAFTGLVGAILNVLINLPQIEDEIFKAEMRQKCEALESDANEILRETLGYVKTEISKM